MSANPSSSPAEPSTSPLGIAIVLPVFNQAANIEACLNAWGHTLEKINRPYEFWLIDDGSTDNTPTRLEGSHPWKNRIRGVRHIRHEQRQGYGACLREVLAETQQPLFFYTGCDFAYVPNDLRKLLDRIEDRTGLNPGDEITVINGYRAGTPLPRGPKLRNRLWRLFCRVAIGTAPEAPMGWLGKTENAYWWKIRAYFGVRLGDINSKFKLFRRSIFERIPIQSDGDFVHAEILAKANFLGCLMDELPIAERPGPFPATPEPASPTSIQTEFRKVFKNPSFGPTIPGTVMATVATEAKVEETPNLEGKDLEPKKDDTTL